MEEKLEIYRQLYMTGGNTEKCIDYSVIIENYYTYLALFASEVEGYRDFYNDKEFLYNVVNGFNYYQEMLFEDSGVDDVCLSEYIYFKYNYIVENNLLKGDKVAIIAEDDFVKTTLFNILCGKDKDYKGMIEWGKTINYGYLPQDNTEYFNTSKNIMEWIGSFYDIKDETILRGFLGRMLFSGEDVFKKVNVLSGGEKARCMLSKMMLEEPNFLVLDEPTNHLDLESITSLNKGMEKFEGEIIFTTRDYELNSTVANRIIEIKSDGTIIDRKMSYEDYLEQQNK